MASGLPQPSISNDVISGGLARGAGGGGGGGGGSGPQKGGAKIPTSTISDLSDSQRRIRGGGGGGGGGHRGHVPPLRRPSNYIVIVAHNIAS